MKISQAVLAVLALLGAGALLGLVYHFTEDNNAIQSSRRLRLADHAYLHAAIGGSGGAGFSVLTPDPENLIWDKDPPEGFPNIKIGWLRVPLHYDHVLAHHESPPSACLRVAVKPARLQPARLGPILFHCGGPGSDARCVVGLGKAIMEINSSYVVNPPLSDDYDYWSISQRGIGQGFEMKVPENCPFKAKDFEHQAKPWPSKVCSGIIGLMQKPDGVDQILKHLDGKPDKATWDNVILPVVNGPSGDLFGFPFYNETYVTCVYRIMRLHFRLCLSEETFFIKSASGRKYNLLKYTGTANLAHDIEVFRKAIGAKKMSIYGQSYGTMVGGVYASMFPTKVHRLILDGDMGRHPDVATFATWNGEGRENTWAGLARACDDSDLGGSAAGKRCAAAPGAARKLQGLLQGRDVEKAHTAFFAFSQCIEQDGVPCAADLMECVAQLDASNTSSAACERLAASDPARFTVPAVLKEAGQSRRQFQWWGILGPGISQVYQGMAQVVGVDYAGHFTEQAFLRWWRGARNNQPLGITFSLVLVAAADAWPVLPRPHPPLGSPLVAPLVVGNLFDPQTPYQNAQSMLEAFPQGGLMTWQGYGHALQLPGNISSVVEQYEKEMEAGKRPSYTNEVAKLLCARMALRYLQNGTLPLDYVCKAAVPAQTGDDTPEL